MTIIEMDPRQGHRNDFTLGVARISKGYYRLGNGIRYKDSFVQITLHFL